MVTLNAFQLLLDATDPRIMPVELPGGVNSIRPNALVDLVDELKSGYPAKLTAPQRMGVVIMRYRETVAAARVGDAASTRDLAEIARVYLDHARAYDPSTWQAAATEVQNDLEALRSVSTQAESSEERRARRYQACVDAGLKFPDNDYATLPRGIGKIAKAMGITRQALSEDLKAHIRRLRDG